MAAGDNVHAPILRHGVIQVDGTGREVVVGVWEKGVVLVPTYLPTLACDFRRQRGFPVQFAVVMLKVRTDKGLNLVKNITVGAGLEELRMLKDSSFDDIYHATTGWQYAWPNRRSPVVQALSHLLNLATGRA